MGVCLSAELLFFKGTTGQITRKACIARMKILTPFFHVFLEHPFGQHFGAFGSIFTCFGPHVASILDARGHTNEAEMHPQLQKAKTKGPYETCTGMSGLHIWPSGNDRRPHKGHQDRDKIFSKLVTFARCILGATFFTFFKFSREHCDFEVPLGTPESHKLSHCWCLFLS